MTTTLFWLIASVFASGLSVAIFILWVIRLGREFDRLAHELREESNKEGK